MSTKRLADFLTPKESEEPEGHEIDGSFGCDSPGCWSSTDQAIYFPEAEVLVFVCEDGHKTRIESFVL